MSPPESDSSLPLPGVQQQTVRSSPPSIIDLGASFEEMEDTAPASKSETADSKSTEGSRPPIIRADSGDTERPPSAQRLNVETNESAGADEEDDLDEDVDPADKISDFDWHELHERYHGAMNNATGQQAELMQEWAELMEYFKIWAEAGHSHETDRTFSRLRTRMAYVENSEDKLERTRQHYISVVKAFESALNLLRNTGFQG